MNVFHDGIHGTHQTQLHLKQQPSPRWKARARRRA